MPHIIRNARAPPVTPRHTAARRVLTLAPEREIGKGGKMPSRDRSRQGKYNQVQHPKQVERGGIRTRNCCINVNYMWQMCGERDCSEGMAVEMLNKGSSVEWWMATLDRTIQRVAWRSSLMSEQGTAVGAVHWSYVRSKIKQYYTQFLLINTLLITIKSGKH